MNKAFLLSNHLKLFFTSYLQGQRGLSKNTISSYRDTFRLLLNFLSVKNGGDFLKEFTVFDLDVKTILSFLNYLEDKEKGRGNSPCSRNLRLAAIHCFFRYLDLQSEVYAPQAKKILSIPVKRSSSSTIGYLEKEELELLFNQINSSTKDGFRDLALILLMYNTGARADEVAHTKLSSLSLEGNLQVRILGKGDKERICPLWPSTARLLKTYIGKYRRTPKKGFEDYLFINQRGQSLTRFGVWDIVKKYLQSAAKKDKRLEEKHLSTHSLRHTTAVHLLESGVELNLIKAWLGHASISTTSRYLDVDLKKKREVLTKFAPPNYVVSFFDEKDNQSEQDENIFDLLKSL